MLSYYGYRFRLPDTNYDLQYQFDNDEESGLLICDVDKNIISCSIPYGVTCIAGYAFSDCTSLTSITIPDSLTRIYGWAFSGCTSLTVITFQGNAPQFGNNCFYDVTATVNYPMDDDSWTENVRQDYGGSLTWMPCKIGDLIYTVLPVDLKAIEDEAFRGLALEAVIIPDGCESIGNYAFADCLNLIYVRIPTSVTSIADDAFDGCPNVVIDHPAD